MCDVTEVLLRQRWEKEDELSLLAGIITQVARSAGGRVREPDYDYPRDRVGAVGEDDKATDPGLRYLQVAGWAGAGDGELHQAPTPGGR